MAKIIFNTRDELIAVDIDGVAVVQADGNYSRIFFINKREINIPMGITKVENALRLSRNKKNKFVRLGRSLIINHLFLQRIDVLKQIITLSDGTEEIRLKVPRNSLKNYKEAIVKSIKIRNNEASIDRN